MRRDIVWPIAGVIGLGILVFSVATLSAQRDRPIPMPMMGMQPGRFTVAHGGAERVVILDTATGQLYVATEKDFKKISELPRFGEMLRPPFRGDGDDRPRPREKDRDRPREKEREGDPERGKEREKDLRREKEKEREKDPNR